jgi:hypothetical protein
MSSGKPQTRGLAALLRLEKERHEREETAADEQSDEPAAGAAAGEELASPLPETAGRFEEGVAAPASSEQQVDAATSACPAPERSEPRQAAAERAGAPTTSLPRPRPAPARRTSAPHKKGASTSEPTLENDPRWERFVADWKPFLREGIKFKLCEFFYRNTMAVGRREFTTSTAQLSRVSGAHRRHIFLVLRQLEALRFIRKESVETNRKDEGLVIHFFPDRQA